VTDGQTDGRHTSCHGIVCAMHTRRAVKIWIKCGRRDLLRLAPFVFNAISTNQTKFSQAGENSYIRVRTYVVAVLCVKKKQIVKLHSCP